MSVLVCENITKISKKKDIIKNFSYNFLENQIYAIIGKSDSGQQELLNLISAKSKPTEGFVYLDGVNLLNNDKINDRICFISSNTNFPHYIKVIDIFKLMAKFYPNWDTYYAFELSTHFDIKHNVNFGSLNINQKSLLIGILGLASRAHITILDNPVEKVDIKARYEFFNFLYHHQEEYPRTFIITTSFIDEIDYLVNYLLLIDKGRLIANFSISEIKDNFRYLTGKTEVLKSLITGVKIIGVEERGKMLTICIRQKLKKDEIRKYQKYLIKISEVPIQMIFIYLINLRELKGIN
jgi:ABC-2 type transport system ATP-binding protein